MSTPCNQSPNQNHGNPENTVSRGNNQPEGYPNQPVSLAGAPRQFALARHQSAPGLGSSCSSQDQGFLFSTVNFMHRWSGKMAAAAGYSPQPPAPYLDRCRPASQSGSKSYPYASRWRRSRTVRIASQMRQRRERWQKDRPTVARVGLNLVMTLVSILVIVSGAGAFYGYDYYQGQLPRVQSLARNTIPQTTRIYDRHGQLLGIVEPPNPSTPVTYNDIPRVLQDAMIAAEDASFWYNNGVDVVGITRALSQYISAGGKVQSGGSTLTQQVIKNLSHDDRIAHDRKLQEAAGAIGLTSQYSKAEILTMYFNIAPFSNSTLGIEAAVEYYFDLQPKNQAFSPQKFSLALGVTQLDIDPTTGKRDPLLGLARASMLAAIPQNPTSHDPTLSEANKARMLERQDYVLNEMVSNNIQVSGLGDVTPAIIKQVKDLTAKMAFKPQKKTKLAPHFVDWVVGQLSLTLGQGNFNAGATVLQQGGFNIRTTLDANLQKYAEASITRHLTKPDKQWFPYIHTATLATDYDVHDSAAVALNTHTGEILTMVGSADYYSTDPQVGGQMNAAAGGAGTQEGSTFKPLVYATAFQLGWHPGTILPDNATYVPNGNPVGAPLSDMYHPPDYGKENGNGKMDTTIRYATDVSWNIPAVKAGAYVGADMLLTNLRRMGLTHVKDIVASSPLGTSNATVLEMTGAYQTFANGGNHIPPQYVLDIWDNYGRSLYHYDPTHPPIVPVFSPEVAYLETSILIDQPTRANEFGADPDLSFAAQFNDCWTDPECSHQVAVKTGTTDKVVNGVDRVPDNWTVGYTPNIAVGVWSGNADGSPMGNVLGVTGAAPIWQSIISTASGYCDKNPEPDELLSCPQDVSPQSLGIDTVEKFPIPSGVQKFGLNDYNGLAGSSNYDYVIKGMEPSSSGIPSDTPKKR